MWLVVLVNGFHCNCFIVILQNQIILPLAFLCTPECPLPQLMYSEPPKLNYGLLASLAKLPALFLLLGWTNSSSSSSMGPVPNNLSPESPSPGKTSPSAFSSSSMCPSVTCTSGWWAKSSERPCLEAMTDIMWIFGTPHCLGQKETNNVGVLFDIGQHKYKHDSSLFTRDVSLPNV